jgi:hypothetical protein
LAVPVLLYSFGIVNRFQEDLQKLDNKRTKSANHPWTAPKGRRKALVCSQKTGGKGLMQLQAYAIEITKLVEYVDKSSSANIDCQNAPTQINEAVLQTCLKTRRMALYETR